MTGKQATVLVLLLALLLAGCAGLQSRQEAPRVTLVGIKVIEIGLLEQRFGLTLRVQNPDRAALDIDGISFTVEINGKSFAQGVGASEVRVPGFGETLLTVRASSTLLDIVEQLRDLEQRNAPVDYRIHGSISQRGSLLRLPFEQRGRLGGGSARPAPTDSGRGI